MTYQSAGSLADRSPRGGAIIITTADIAAQLVENTKFESEQTILIVDYPRRSFAAALGMIVETATPGSDDAFIDRSAQIHPNATIGAGVVIGAGSIIEAGAVLRPGVELSKLSNRGE